MKLLNKLFGQAEEINGGERCPTYMYRWTMIDTRWGKVYLHKFVGDDWSYDLHDHPKRFISIGLYGSYLEETPINPNFCGSLTTRRRYRAPWIRSFPPEHKHRITTPFGHCWTLVIVGPWERDWGFWHDGKFMRWDEYVSGKDGIAEKMKACD